MCLVVSTAAAKSVSSWHADILFVGRLKSSSWYRRRQLRLLCKHSTKLSCTLFVFCQREKSDCIVAVFVFASQSGNCAKFWFCSICQCAIVIFLQLLVASVTNLPSRNCCLTSHAADSAIPTDITAVVVTVLAVYCKKSQLPCIHASGGSAAGVLLEKWTMINGLITSRNKFKCQ